MFNEGGTKRNIRDLVIQACQFDKRTQEYIGPVSRIFYKLIPNLWYRRDRGILANIKK